MNVADQLGFNQLLHRFFRRADGYDVHRGNVVRSELVCASTVVAALGYQSFQLNGEATASQPALTIDPDLPIRSIYVFPYSPAGRFTMRFEFFLRERLISQFRLFHDANPTLADNNFWPGIHSAAACPKVNAYDSLEFAGLDQAAVALVQPAKAIPFNVTADRVRLFLSQPPYGASNITDAVCAFAVRSTNYGA